jgi:6-phospho-beta-glucosidase
LLGVFSKEIAVFRRILMKITVIGAGSSYTPELIHGFIERAPSLPVNEIWLMDIDAERLQIVGNFAERMAAASQAPFKIIKTTSLQEAIQGSSYVITQFRVGMLAARRADEYLGKRHGLIGQETNGVGGMAKALRTIPVLLNIAEEIRRSAPAAVLVNFTNPSGLNTEALMRYAPDVCSVGVCNGPITTKMRILDFLGELRGETIEPQRGFLDTLGLNHFGWYRGFTLDGEDIWPEILQHVQQIEEDLWDAKTIENLGMIPNSYLQYYYYTQDRIQRQAAWPPSRAETVQTIEETLFKQYADPHLVSLPPELMQRGGAYYSTLATQLINAHFNDLHEVHIVNRPNQGAVEEWPADWVLEMPCVVNASGFHPIKTESLPPVCFGLMTQMKMYELLTVEAAVKGDRQAAYQALIANPLGPAADHVEEVLLDLLHTNQPHLPQFFPGSAA